MDEKHKKRKVGDALIKLLKDSKERLEKRERIGIELVNQMKTFFSNFYKFYTIIKENREKEVKEKLDDIDRLYL